MLQQQQKPFDTRCIKFWCWERKSKKDIDLWSVKAIKKALGLGIGKC